MSPIDRTTVLVLHEDQIIRTGLAAALGGFADFDVLDAQGPVHSDSTLDAWTDRSVEVVIADYERGVALADEIRSRPYMKNSPGIMIISTSDREWDLRYALASGVRGYMLFGCEINELAAGVRAVRQGERHFSAAVARRLADSLMEDPLTIREQDVLRLVISGHCNKVIGTRLSIAVGTVKSHIRSIFDKLDVESRTQAIAAAQRRGLLQAAPQRGTASSLVEAGNVGRPSYGTATVHACAYENSVGAWGRSHNDTLASAGRR